MVEEEEINLIALGLRYPNKEIKENYLKALEFRYPEWIPCTVGFSPAAWKAYRKKLEDIVVRHPLIFGAYKKGSRNSDDLPPVRREREYFRDNRGCLWYNIQGRKNIQKHKRSNKIPKKTLRLCLVSAQTLSILY